MLGLAGPGMALFRLYFLVGKVVQQCPELGHPFLDIFEPCRGLPNFDIHAGPDNHHIFVRFDPEKLAKTFWYGKPSASRQVDGRVACRKESAK